MVEKKVNSKLIIRCVVIVIVLIAIFIGTRQDKVTIGSESIKIGGMYGVEISYDEVTQVELGDTLPKIQSRLNGIDFIGIRKGIFRMDDLGKVKMFSYSTKGPFIFIITESEDIVINYKKSDDTRKLYDEITENLAVSQNK